MGSVSSIINLSSFLDKSSPNSWAHSLISFLLIVPSPLLSNLLKTSLTAVIWSSDHPNLSLTLWFSAAILSSLLKTLFWGGLAGACSLALLFAFAGATSLEFLSFVVSFFVLEEQPIVSYF